ncbi:MAG: 5,6-dimethylbenzimidazole synthase [Pseudomonadota bacterium]
MKFTAEHTDTLLELMKWRRDVRHFRQDPVPPETLAFLKQAVDLAPSVGNSRPWRFVEVASPEIRARVIANFESSNQAASQGYDPQRQAEYLQLKLAGLREAPVHLAVFTDLSPREGDGLGRQTMPETLTYSTITAIHQLWLVARTMNLGVGWVSILDTTDMNALIGVDPDWVFTAYLCVGYPTQEYDTPELQRRGWQENISREWLTR